MYSRHLMLAFAFAALACTACSGTADIVIPNGGGASGATGSAGGDVPTAPQSVSGMAPSPGATPDSDAAVQDAATNPFTGDDATTPPSPPAPHTVCVLANGVALDCLSDATPGTPAAPSWGWYPGSVAEGVAQGVLIACTAMPAAAPVCPVGSACMDLVNGEMGSCAQVP